MATWGEVTMWRPGELTLAAERARLQATQWRRQGDVVGTRVAGWKGDAAQVAASRAKAVASKAELMATRLDGVRRASLQAAEGITALQSTITEVQHYAAANELRISASGLVSDAAEPGVFDSRVEADAHTAARQRVVDTCVAMMNAVLERADAIDAALVGALATVRLISPDTSVRTNAVTNTNSAMSSATAGTYGSHMNRDALRYAEQLKERASQYRATALASDYAPEGNRLLNLADELNLKEAHLRGQADLYTKAANLRALKAGGALAVVGIGADIASGTDPTQAVVSGAAGFGASIAAGAMTGAAIGSIVPIPGFGTIGGAIVGAGIGVFTSGAVNSLFENGPDVGKAWNEGIQAVADTRSALLDMGKSAWNSFEGLF